MSLLLIKTWIKLLFFESLVKVTAMQTKKPLLNWSRTFLKCIWKFYVPTIYSFLVIHVKFVILSKVTYFLTVAFFLFLNKFLRLTDLRTYKCTIFRPCYYLQAIMYSLLCYFYDCLWKGTISLDEYQFHFNVFI